jgi:D-3-phosphoglycerate dehydrogenase / 2-oxoglutarate reductase
MREKKKILVTATNYSTYCAAAKKMLEDSGFEVMENRKGRPLTYDELKDMVREVSGAVVGVDTWNEEVFKCAPKLKVLSRFGVGVDNIDLNAAKEYGIAVTNAKGQNSNSVAELTVGLILSSMRNVPAFNDSVRQGRWDRFMGRDLVGKTVGLLGFGDIAQRVAKKLCGFDVNVCAFDKYPNMKKAEELNVSMAEMDEVLACADVVSLHLPVMKETHHIMNQESFGKMKNGSYFINTARGVLVDENALYQVLKNGKLTAAAIDVFEEEPVKSTNRLFELNNLFVTPHTAAETYETYHTVGLVTAKAVMDVLDGKTPDNRLV